MADWSKIRHCVDCGAGNPRNSDTCIRCGALIPKQPQRRLRPKRMYNDTEAFGDGRCDELIVERLDRRCVTAGVCLASLDRWHLHLSLLRYGLVDSLETPIDGKSIIRVCHIPTSPDPSGLGTYSLDEQDSVCLQAPSGRLDYWLYFTLKAIQTHKTGSDVDFRPHIDEEFLPLNDEEPVFDFTLYFFPSNSGAI